MPKVEPTGPRSFSRELLFELPSSSNLERSGDALIVRGVKLLAAGTWTDSAAKTPCSYGPDALREYAGNWADSSLWSRHAGGQPRTINQKVGRIENQHFEEDAVVGDLVLHGLAGTDSPGAIAMIEAGEADYFSAELTGTERWNAERKMYEMQSITFLGGAVVNRGACSTCTLRHNEAGGDDAMTLKQADSLEGRIEAIRVALTKEIGATYDDGSPAFAWVILTFADSVIYRHPRSGALYSISYTADGETFAFGTPVEVDEVYVEKKALELMPALPVDQVRAMLDGTKHEDTMTAELEAKIAALETANADLVRQLGEAQETNAKLSAEFGTLRDELREIEGIKARLLKVEQTPMPKAGAPAEPARELSVPAGLTITKTEIYREI